MSDKITQRQQALRSRRALSAGQRASASAHIQQRLIEHLAQEPRLKGSPLLLYRSLDEEVDTGSLFDIHARTDARAVYAPVTHHSGHMLWRRIHVRTDWQRGDFGVLEPASGEVWSQDEAAILICPLVGFDRKGNRLGMGKGCFDRWLAGTRNHILVKIGLAFSCQECAAIAAEKHDIPLDMIITEGEIITCRNC